MGGILGACRRENAGGISGQYGAGELHGVCPNAAAEDGGEFHGASVVRDLCVQRICRGVGDKKDAPPAGQTHGKRHEAGRAHEAQRALAGAGIYAPSQRPESDGRIGHVGIVAETKDGYVLSIDGNTVDPTGCFPEDYGGAVDYRARRLDDARIMGYAEME